ncbi:MAG: hypothetical protein Q4D88_00765 [Anaerococcus sp.]|nr:hypothetical protein [Anaerococcus sp.]
MDGRRKSTRDYHKELDLDQRARARAKRRMERRKREKRLRIGGLLLILILILTLILSLRSKSKSQVDKFTKAIKGYDINYLEDKSDRMALIMDVLGKSYSNDEAKAKEFIASNFTNLTVEYVGEEKKDGGKEVSLDISNVNYIDVYDSLDINKNHEDYMERLKDEKSPRANAKVTIFIKNSLFGYEIFESRAFVNAILGGALDYVKE